MSAHDSDKALTARAWSPFIVPQNVKIVERHKTSLYGDDRNEVANVIDTTVARNNPQTSRLGWFKVTKRVLHIWDSAEYDSDVQSVVSCCIKAAYVKAHTIFFITSNDV